MAEKYIIRVTAGSEYDLSKQVEVPVNSSAPTKISNAFCDAELNVRVRNYRGLPRDSPSSSPYFDAEPHMYNNDQYSIGFRFTPKRPPFPTAGGDGSKANDDDAAPGGDEADIEPHGISGHDLQWGNDFDHAIRDRLPPGFGTAMNIVKWWIDPGLEGDPYADSPYLFGPAISSFNAVHVGSGEHDDERGGLWFEEGGDEKGLSSREALGMPADGKARMKWALRPENKERWFWEYDQMYGVDFFNAYVDFSEFALRLPGYNLPIMKYWDGQSLRAKRSHTLRYVLRNRATSDVLLVVVFTLYLKEDVNEDGTLKPAALQKPVPPSGATDPAGRKSEDDFDHDKAVEEARRKLSTVAVDADDDVD